MTDTAEQHWRRLGAAMGRLHAEAPRVQRWGEHLARTLSGGGRLLACGNGGSAAEAQHLTGELVGRFRADRPPFSAIALHADTSAATAILNDYGEHEYFARAVRAHGRPGDILIALSTSGTSHNVINAAKAALQEGLTVWGMTGPGPNQLATLADDAIAVDAETTATVQEAHLSIVHALCGAFDDALGATSGGAA
ncbi:D-sedoheptulose-7-phosphate isomerase [Glycomyces arizonensis]|uniref:D-sedoheptulose-7-phosphate isomerase n=1 Tax=Glycomyces arizonensis TaxID=256035 RepID=UPI0003FED6FB|nr:SIS domain-containing protein [Glycomyces arizonensis]